MALPNRRDDSPAGGQHEPAPDWRAAYEIESPAEVDAYVTRHPFLVPLLAEAPLRIAEHFGTHHGLVLEAPVDPEDGSQLLCLYIRAMGNARHVAERRDRLDDRWWLDALVAARTRLIVDVEFI